MGVDQAEYLLIAPWNGEQVAGHGDCDDHPPLRAHAAENGHRPALDDEQAGAGKVARIADLPRSESHGLAEDYDAASAPDWERSHNGESVPDSAVVGR